jgi:hypothetical protein
MQIPEELARAALDVMIEREQQIGSDGYLPGHDDAHEDGSLACAGAAYALNAGCLLHPDNGTPLQEPPIFWMWRTKDFKPKLGIADARRELVRAAALIVAEIARYDRQHPPAAAPTASDNGIPAKAPINPAAAWPFPDRSRV